MIDAGHVLLGMLIGWVAAMLFNSWGAAYKVCCRDHYKTHATCRCADCVRDREVP